LKNLLKTLFLLLFPAALLAQNFVEYVPMQNTDLPIDYNNLSAERYIALNEQYAPTDTRQIRRQKEAFFLQNNYVVQDLLKSGTVLFDTEFNVYLKQIAAKILVKDTALLKVTQFYLVRSPAVNAFATQDGSVFIYMGLMAALRNEAELAFVLSHELSHVRQQHALDFFIKTNNIGQKNTNVAQNTFKNNTDDALKQLNNYSQQNELLADFYGYQNYFSSSGYNLNAPENVLNILRYGYLPFENKPFEKAFWEDAHLVFPANYELQWIRKIGNGAENTANERSTHPAIATRRAQLKGLIAADTQAESLDLRPDFLVSETRFAKWKQACKFELPQLFLHYNDFQEAIYSAYLLLHEAPKDLYLKKCIAKGLYGFAKFRNDTTETCAAEIVSFKGIEGESQQLYHFLEQLDGNELTLLAFNYTKNLSEEFNDFELNTIKTDLINELQHFYFKNINEMRTFANDNPDIYFSKALKKYLEEPKFLKAYTLQAAQNRQRNEWVEQPKNNTQKTVVQLGIRKIVIANNSFKSLDTRKGKNRIEHSESLLGAKRFEAAVRQNAKKTKLNFAILPTEPSSNTPAERTLFNHRVLLNEWFSEQLSFGKMPFAGYQAERIKAIADELDCDYFLWTGAVQIRRPKDGVAMATSAIMGIGIYPLLPFAAYSIAKADYSTVIYGVLYNVNTRESRIVKYETVSGNLPNAVINSHLYDMFRQIGE
jgi:beta-barrel assembly-enhancing protease